MGRIGDCSAPSSGDIGIAGRIYSALFNVTMSDDAIDLVLVTGAGASCDFGVNETRLPLMAEWSRLILRKLGGVPGFVDAVGLTDSMTGPQFEERLGEFLQSAIAFGGIKPLLGPLGKMLQANPPSTVGNLNNTWEAWHSQAQHQINQVLGKIYESLYENFSAPNIDAVHVRNAYANLLNQLGITERSRWVYATTNYDVIADAALESLGLRFHDGTDSPRFGNTAERQFRVAGLLSVIDRDVPLLHLHGRVGWLVRAGSSPSSGPYAVDNLVNWTDSFGVPLVMLPDPRKDPGSDGIIGQMWTEFDEALRRARRVLVLGHSLHDAPLVDALSEPDGRGKVAVTLLGDPDAGELHDDAREVAAIMEQQLPSAHRVIMRFGRDYGPRPSMEMERWLEATAS
jgi:hypothetical protein